MDMSLCFVNIDKLKSFKLKKDDNYPIVIEIGGYKYQMNFVVYEFDFEKIKSNGDITIRLKKNK
jgi:hypothetical protein